VGGQAARASPGYDMHLGCGKGRYHNMDLEEETGHLCERCNEGTPDKGEADGKQRSDA